MCVDGITKEGARVPGNCAHVRYPKAPTVIYGISPLEAGAVAKQRAAVARDAIGKKLRCDGKVLGAIVLSYPVPRQLVEHDIYEKAIYRDWCAQSKNWLQAEFGRHLLSVVEHADEAFLHVHAYGVPELLPDNRLDWGSFHPGRKAAAAAAASGATSKDKNAAYCGGMRAWQDRFHAVVSKGFGHKRFGPRRERLLRMNHLANKAIAENKAAAEADLVRQRDELTRDRLRIEEVACRAARERYSAPWRALRGENAALKQDKAALIETKTRMLEALAVQTARTKRAEAEIEVLRQRLAELEPDPSLQFVA
jgi:hypothetical protein